MSGMTDSASPPPLARPDTIVIRGLTVEASIGVLPEERSRRQRVSFDIEIHTVPGYAAAVSATGRYVSYADTVQFIRALAAHGGHIDLVEDWAERVATFVLANDMVASVRVSVLKPEIFEDAQGVGIVIERAR